MNKITTEQREKLIMVGLGTLVAIGCVWFFLIRSLQIEWAGLRAKMNPALMEKSRFWTKKSWVDQTRQEWEMLRQVLDAKENTMAPNDKLKWFRNTLEEFMPRYGINLTQLSSEPQIGEVGLLPNFAYQAATFKVQVVAGYSNLGMFLRDFENHFPLVRVQKLAIQLKNETPSASSQDPASSLGVTMEITVLVKPGSV